MGPSWWAIMMAVCRSCHCLPSDFTLVMHTCMERCMQGVFVPSQMVGGQLYSHDCAFRQALAVVHDITGWQTQSLTITPLLAEACTIPVHM